MEIDDAEPAHADRAALLNMKALVVRSTMLDLIAHGANRRQIRHAVSEDITGYPAHGRLKVMLPLSQFGMRDPRHRSQVTPPSPGGGRSGPCGGSLYRGRTAPEFAPGRLVRAGAAAPDHRGASLSRAPAL